MNSHKPCALADPVDMFPIITAASDQNPVRVVSVSAAQPQPVLAPLTPAAIFLVATIDDGGEAAVHDALPELSGLVRAIGFRDTAKRLSMVTSIGSTAWDRLFAGPAPAALPPLRALSGPRPTGTAP